MKLIALGLTIALAVFIVISFALVLVGPTLAEKVAAWVAPRPGLQLDAGTILQWPVVFALVTLGDRR